MITSPPQDSLSHLSEGVMAKSYLIFLIVLLAIAHGSARNIPNYGAKPTTTSANALAPVVAMTTANGPSVNGVDDEKNFITYGGVGGWAGIGGYAGVIPVLGGSGLGGLGGGSGVGGLGGLGGVGGLGGLGGAGGGVGGGAGGGAAGGKIVP